MAALVSTWSGPSNAAGKEDCIEGTKPRVAVEFEGALWGPNLRAEVLEHLRAGLSTERLAICSAESAAGPSIAAIVLSRDDPDTVAVKIDIRDDVTGKRVVRDVDLRRVPPDGRALGVAVAADELLRASWVELALADRPDPPAPPPPEVEEVMVESLDAPYRPAPERHELGARATGEHYTGGQTHLGGELAFRTWLSPRFGLELSVGLKDALTVTTSRGDIDGVAAGGGASVVWSMTGPGVWALQAEAGGYLAQVRLRGKPSGNATGSDGAALIAYARSGLALSFEPGSVVGMRVRAGVGAPLSTLAIESGERTATEVSGLEIYSGVGAYARF